MACQHDSLPRPAAGLRELPDDLYGYAHPPHRRVGHPLKTNPAIRTVTDDWPARVPVTDAEVELFEAWFGDLFDEIVRTPPMTSPEASNDRSHPRRPLPPRLHRPAGGE